MAIVNLEIYMKDTSNNYRTIVKAEKEENNIYVKYSFNLDDNNITTYKFGKLDAQIININRIEKTEVRILLSKNGLSKTTITYQNNQLILDTKLMNYECGNNIKLRYMIENDPDNIHYLEIKEKR